MMRRLVGTAALFAGLATLIGCGIIPRAVPGIGGTTWRVVSVAGIAPVAGAEPTARFEDDKIQGTTGCNSYSARFHIEGSTLTISDMVSTAMSCPDPIASGAGIFMKALATARTIKFDGPNLVISGDVGDIVFRAEP